MSWMELGESFVGGGVDAAHVNTMFGPRDGPVGVAWATALATPTAGHAPFVAVLQPGVPVKPFTLFVNKATIDGDTHARMTWGAAQAGVATGVADAVADEVLSIDDADRHALIVAVWVDPDAADPAAVFANNREAVRSALALGRAGLPSAAEAITARDEAWNPFYRPERSAVTPPG